MGDSRDQQDRGLPARWPFVSTCCHHFVLARTLEHARTVSPCLASLLLASNSSNLESKLTFYNSGPSFCQEASHGTRLGLPSEARARFPDAFLAFLLPARLRAQQITPGLTVPSPRRVLPLWGCVWSSSLQPWRYGDTPGPALTHTQGREVLLPLGVSLLPAPEATITLCSALFPGVRREGLDVQRRPGMPPTPTLGALCPLGLLRLPCPPLALCPLLFLCRLLNLDLLSVWCLLCPGGQKSWGPGSVSWFTARTSPPALSVQESGRERTSVTFRK